MADKAGEFSNAPFYSFVIAVGPGFTAGDPTPAAPFQGGFSTEIFTPTGDPLGVAFFSGGTIRGNRVRTFFEGVSFGTTHLVTGDSDDDLFQGGGFKETCGAGSPATSRTSN